MLDKNTYHKMKMYIKHLCKINVLELCENLQLDDYEKSLLLMFYEGKKQVEICMKLNISTHTYTNHLKSIMYKIYNYKNTLD